MRTNVESRTPTALANVLECDSAPGLASALARDRKHISPSNDWSTVEDVPNHSNLLHQGPRDV